MSRVKTVLNNLKKGLTEDEKVQIASAFDDAVEERAKIEVAAIVEAQLKGIFERVTKDFDEQSKRAVEALRESVGKDLDEVEKSIDKYVTFFVKENLPKEMVSEMTRGIKYSQYLEKLEEAVKVNLESKAVSELNEAVKKLQEELNTSKQKYTQLFEKMVDDSNTQLVEHRKVKFFSMIDNFPDVTAKIMRNVAETSIDFANLSDSELPSRVKMLAESVTRAMKNDRSQKLEEQKKTAKTESKGVTETENKLEEQAVPEVEGMLSLLERM